MTTKSYNRLFRMVMALAVVLLVSVFINGVQVHADNGKTVRVSTSKELSAAIKKADVGTIIFRTQAYISLTIKQNKAASEKFLIIDAPNATITNKANFAEINIINASKYTENVSGNRISISDAYFPNGFTVAKKKTVESITNYSTYGSFALNYTIRKGGKIKEQSYVFTGSDAPVESTYNAKKRTVTLVYDDYGITVTYKVTLDKSGRKIKESSDSDLSEFSWNYEYTYDSNGNLLKMEGTENLSGDFTSNYTLSGNLRVKSVYKDAYSSGTTVFNYDAKGRLIGTEYTGKNQMDGQTFSVGYIDTFEYDKKGRLIYETSNATEGEYNSEVSYTYNSKGFLTEKYVNNSGSETVFKYKYNKGGDCISESHTSENYSDTITYKYDKLGNLLKENLN